MFNAEIVPYDVDRHRDQFFQMFIEYATWLNNEVNKYYGTYLVSPSEERKVFENMIPQFTAIKPPEGIIYILEIAGEPAGMGRLIKLKEGIGEVNQVYIRPEHRRKGYSTLLMRQIEDKAKEFGFSALRLDTAKFNLPAQNLYRKLGYEEIDRYTEVGKFENESLRKYYAEKVYMEKEL